MLTPKQQAFCDNYIVSHNATDAAIRAGYSAKTARSQGQMLLSGWQWLQERCVFLPKMRSLRTDFSLRFIFRRADKYNISMKATFKNISIALSLLLVVLVILISVDNAASLAAVSAKTQIKVTVVDLEGKPVHNANVTVQGQSFKTDNKGASPSIELKTLKNCYDANVTEWGTETVTVTCKNYVTAVTFNCVVYFGQTRKLTVKIYPKDASDLPYVSYVESPPDEYVKELLAQNSAK